MDELMDDRSTPEASVLLQRHLLPTANLSHVAPATVIVEDVNEISLVGALLEAYARIRLDVVHRET